MSIQRNYSLKNLHQTEIVIPTRDERWVLPCNGELVKLLLEKQSLRAGDLCFGSVHQCQCFIRQLFLLALEDEWKTQSPSSLAKFARAMIKQPHA